MCDLLKVTQATKLVGCGAGTLICLTLESMLFLSGYIASYPSVLLPLWPLSHLVITVRDPLQNQGVGKAGTPLLSSRSNAIGAHAPATATGWRDSGFEDSDPSPWPGVPCRFYLFLQEEDRV